MLRVYLCRSQPTTAPTNGGDLLQVHIDIPWVCVAIPAHNTLYRSGGFAYTLWLTAWPRLFSGLRLSMAVLQDRSVPFVDHKRAAGEARD